MGCWKKFLILRKQRDSIKIMLLLIVAAVGFGASAVSRGVSIYHIVNSPVEYVVSTSQRHMPDFNELEDLVAASFQQENSRTVLYQGQEYQISYITLSEEYLSKVYKIEARGVTETFYMNRPALRQLGTADRELFVNCPSEETDGNDTAALQLQTTVKLKFEEGILDQENPMAFVLAKAGSQQSDPADSRKIRICFDRQDLDGSQSKKLENMGLTVENGEEFLEDEYDKTELLLRMKYEALLGSLLAIGAIFAFKYGKK